MLAVLASSPIEPVKPGSLMTFMNGGGSKKPLFWCFNVPRFEASALAENLGRDQPLYCLFSGAGSLERRPETPGALAEHYLDEILSVQPDGPYRIGGNCGGARVVFEMALRLIAQGRDVERLCLMEFFDPRLFEYPGRMLLLYGRESALKLHESFRWLEPGWSEAFRAVPEVDWIPGAHGEFFRKRNVPSLAARISTFLNGKA
jgi:thioesterase domain-containing protein